jgi:hypothetical protein
MHLDRFGSNMSQSGLMHMENGTPCWRSTDAAEGLCHSYNGRDMNCCTGSSTGFIQFQERSLVKPWTGSLPSRGFRHSVSFVQKTLPAFH